MQITNLLRHKKGDEEMKYKQFEKVMNDLGLTFREENDFIYVDSKEGFIVLTVSKQKRFSFEHVWPAFYGLLENEKTIVFKNATELASTPPNEREEEKRYRLKANLPQLKVNIYLCVYNDSFVLTNTLIVSPAKTIFTESELESIDETGFKRDEVTKW